MGKYALADIRKFIEANAQHPDLQKTIMGALTAGDISMNDLHQAFQGQYSMPQIQQFLGMQPGSQFNPIGLKGTTQEVPGQNPQPQGIGQPGPGAQPAAWMQWLGSQYPQGNGMPTQQSGPTKNDPYQVPNQAAPSMIGSANGGNYQYTPPAAPSMIGSAYNGGGDQSNQGQNPNDAYSRGATTEPPGGPYSGGNYQYSPPPQQAPQVPIQYGGGQQPQQPPQFNFGMGRN